MIGEFALPPGLVMLLGGAFVPLLGERWRSAGVLLLASLSLVIFCLTPGGTYGQFPFLGVAVTAVRIDPLSNLFGLVFHFAAILAAIFAWHLRDWRQQTAGTIYAGAAIAACFAGDLLTLFVYWELTAIASVFLVWAGGTRQAYRSGMRYLIVQVGSGVLLLSGVVIQYVETQTLDFVSMTPASGVFSLGPLLILIAIGIKAAFPLLHNWLQDSYPQSTPSGTVYLSAFTTKLAIYALARGFPGTEALIWIGCAMTLFPIIFAVIENDLRRVLAYSLNNQLGFMVVGIGIGSQLAINGAVAHAFCHIIYKSLLLMSMGAVLYRVGTVKATELGGLYRSMPWTTGCCLIGAGAISGFPLLSGFISKSMILSAAGEAGLFWVWIILLVASAGVMEHSGIKIPFFAFFAHDSGKRPPEAPLHMLVAMVIAAGLCVLLGIAYPLLYRGLPHQATYQPYTVAHVITQLQLLMFAALAFVFLMKTKRYPAEQRAINLDTDWIYRQALPTLVAGFRIVLGASDRFVRNSAVRLIVAAIQLVKSWFDEHALFGRPWSSGTMTFWAGVLLASCLLLYYWTD